MYHVISYNGMLLNKCKASSKDLSEVLACATAGSNIQSKVCNMQAIMNVRMIVVLIERLQPVLS